MEKPSKIEGPNHIWANIRRDWFHADGKPYSEDDVKYIRADLVGKLEDYVSHSRDCRKLRSFKNPCTCGLAELLGEME